MLKVLLFCKAVSWAVPSVLTRLTLGWGGWGVSISPHILWVSRSLAGYRGDLGWVPRSLLGRSGGGEVRCPAPAGLLDSLGQPGYLGSALSPAGVSVGAAAVGLASLAGCTAGPSLPSLWQISA